MPNRPTRRSHYVPACMLSGFTRSGTKQGDLYVVDRVRGKHWPTTPLGAGHQRDFYMVERSDPLTIEAMYGQMEDRWGPMLRAIEATDSLPTARDDRHFLIGLVTSLHTRVPQARAIARDGYEQFARALHSVVSHSYAAYSKVARDAGLDDSEDAYRRYRTECPLPDAWPDQTRLVLAELEMNDRLYPYFERLTWTLLVSRTPEAEFICSDRPVSVLGQSALGAPDVAVHMPLSRRHAMVGTLVGSAGMVLADPKLVATLNGETMRRAQMLYAPTTEFIFMDARRGIVRGLELLLGKAG